MADKEVEVEPLENFSGKIENSVKKKVRDEHGSALIPVPKRMLQQIGLKLNQEVIIICKENTNPFQWEIVIKPAKNID